MALSAVSLSFSIPSKHLGAFEGKNQLLIRGKKSKYSSIARKNKGFSPVTIRCFKGQLIPSPEVLKRITSTPIPTSNGGVVPSTVIPVVPSDLNVNDFPTDFMFGAGISALQSEGSLDVDGRGPSTWDSLIADGTAADSYHRYKEDVQALKNMGVDTYRFSISWSRILPDGTVKGGINQKGIDHYNNVIDELIANGITPFVTLFHFDLPVGLQNKYNGFLGSEIVSDFMNYADVCFKYFGDRVKHWSTINEPQVFGEYLYRIGLPETTIQNPATDPFIAMHNIILAHATAAKHYKDNYQSTQKGEIGIAVVTVWLIPQSDTRENKQAAERGMDFSVGWLLDPIVYGDYPFNMKALVRDALPTFTEEQKALIKGSYDYIGINYYSSRFAYSTPISPYEIYTSYDQYQHSVSTPEDANGNLVGEQVNADMYVHPEGLRDILLYVKEEYQSPKIYITENGTPDGEGQDPIEDTPRIRFMQVHLKAILEAIKMEANVKGYFHWSMIDAKELGTEGYTTRMGLVRIPYPTVLDAPPSDPSELDRIPKKSSQWYNAFLSQRKK